MGNYEFDFLNQVKLYIFDGVGDYYIFTYNVTVGWLFSWLKLHIFLNLVQCRVCCQFVYVPTKHNDGLR